MRQGKPGFVRVEIKTADDAASYRLEVPVGAPPRQVQLIAAEVLQEVLNALRTNTGG